MSVTDASTGDPGFCFRLRLRLPEGLRLGIDEVEFVVDGPPGSSPVILKSTAVDPTPISDSTQLALLGRGYPTEQDALVAADEWRSWMTIACATANLGADFGDRSFTSVLTEAGQQWMQVQFNAPLVLGDAPVSVYPCDPKPVFVSTSATALVTRGADPFVVALRDARDGRVVVDESHRLAFDLYSASFVQPAPDAQFLMLMMAIETLTVPKDRPSDQQAHVQNLIDLTKASTLPGAAVQSMVGALSWMFQESINAAGRALVTTLEPNEYDGRSPSAFFTGCYEIRSRLVHGADPRPDSAEVNRLAAPLERMVADLLAANAAR